MSEVKCLRHIFRDAVGYCTVCGEMGCEECLTEHEGNLYCKRDYAPFEKAADDQRKIEQARKRPERQRLVIHAKDGRILYGVCYALKIDEDTFQFELMDKQGAALNKTMQVKFDELKALFYVKSFDGNFGQGHPVQEWKPEGNALVVEFQDGEVVEGHSHRAYRSSDARFFLVPDDPESNNISILVERSAVKSVHTPESFSHKWREEIDTFIRQNRDLGFSQREYMGDFFFHRHDYGRAMRQYRYAFEEDAANIRLRKKMIATEYNIGMRYIRHHEYERAIHCMQQVLQADPANERAKQKSAQLEDFLRRKAAGARDENPPSAD